MLYACAARFDVTENLKKNWKLNKAYEEVRQVRMIVFKEFNA